ncbi:MAG TPA: malto-oligosyltrehalose synthase [Planctomycetota bacterium]|nr:malto-oligosyltrehalose synthase [Planctomycetota bacterium]
MSERAPRPAIATYRLQLRPGFGFDEAARVAEYLAALGASHVYLSPVLEAVAGSEHGYDVVDHRRVREDFGGRAGHERLVEALGENGLGCVLDIVPNHMAISSPANLWWWDVLENGQASRYASYFDVEWDPPEGKLRNRILLPILREPFGAVVERREIRLERSDGAFRFRYREHVLPVAPRSIDGLLRAASAGSDELAFQADAHAALPPSTARDAASVARRHRDKEVLRTACRRLFAERPELAAAVDREVAATNADADALEALLDRQNYRVAHWRTAGRELGYRRFFDVNSLAGLRVEDERVFEDTHALVREWVAEGKVDGLRVDHVDGLCDPAEYLGRLRAAAPRARIVVEKILAPDERLPREWPVEGTTGYDFLNVAGGLFVDPAAEAPLTQLYEEITGGPSDFATSALEGKQNVLREVLGSDVNRLTAMLVDIGAAHRRSRDFTRHELHEAVRELIAALPVYRTYVRPAAGTVRDEDAHRLREAAAAARARRADLDGAVFDFLLDLLCLRVRGELESELVLRFQQLTGAAMAKGAEDTALYAFARFLALNEVGSDPTRFGTSVEEFHRRCEEMQRLHPATMLATSTHDTKRSEDVRARLYAISEMPATWGELVRAWRARSEPRRRSGGPSPAGEYLLYQTLVGAWPIDEERLLPYVRKAAREAKTHTSWTEPNAAFEEALLEFTRGTLADARLREEIERLVAELDPHGKTNSLALTLLKLTCPGVPDLYQGTELWDRSLVDPDNRRPVDYGERMRLLAELPAKGPIPPISRVDRGAPKLALLRRALALRRRHPERFGPEAAYRPIEARGEKAPHVVAFARGDSVVVVVPRLSLRLGPSWGDTSIEIDRGAWHDELSDQDVRGGPVAIAALLARAPVALLSRR